MSDLQVIRRQRGGGKTTEALRRFLNDPRAWFVCASASERERVAALVPKERRHQVISVASLPLRGVGEVRIIVDNLEWVLRILMGGQVDAVTVTKEADREA